MDKKQPELETYILFNFRFDMNLTLWKTNWRNKSIGGNPVRVILICL